MFLHNTEQSSLFYTVHSDWLSSYIPLLNMYKIRQIIPRSSFKEKFGFPGLGKIWSEMMKRLLLIYPTFFTVLFITGSRYLPSLTFSPLLLSLFMFCIISDLKHMLSIKMFRFTILSTMYSGMLPWGSYLTSVSFSFLTCKWRW